MSVPRLVLASLLATGLGCLAYLFLHSFWGYVIFVVFLVNPLMLLLAFERTAPKALTVLYFHLLIVYAGLGGLVSLLDLYLPAEIRDFLLPLACALFFFAYGHCIDLTGKEKRAAGSGDPGVWACGKNAGTRRYRKSLA